MSAPDHAPHSSYKILLALTGASTHIHDDDVAGLQNCDELLLDIGAETLAVDRAVEDARCREPIPAQRAEEGQRAPVAMWSQAAQPLAFRPPSWS